MDNVPVIFIMGLLISGTAKDTKKKHSFIDEFHLLWLNL